MPLTVFEVTNAKPKEKPYKLTDGDGMFLFVHPNGGRYWRFKYYFLGKEKLMALGVYPDVTLAEARERRYQARKVIAAGNEPMKAKHLNGDTFRHRLFTDQVLGIRSRAPSPRRRAKAFRQPPLMSAGALLISYSLICFWCRWERSSYALGGMPRLQQRVA